MATSAANSKHPNILEVGLTVLHDPVNAIADILFIHGLQGHPRKTWACKAPSDVTISSSNSSTTSSHHGIRHLFSWKERNESKSNLKAEAAEVYWPLDLLPNDCNDVRIMTWGYDSKVSQFFKGPANRSNINTYARDLLYRLGISRLDCTRSLIFVAHSLGGIIVKEVLCRAAIEQEATLLDIYTSTKAILFLGTPHWGSAKAETGETLRKIVSATGFSTNERNIRTLYINSSELEGIHERFMKLRQESRSNFKVSTFQEGRGMTGVSFLKLGEKVVEEFSSTLDGTERRQTINANHMAMCRFSSKHDDGYEKVIGELQFYLSTVRKAFESAEPESNTHFVISRVASSSQATTASSNYSLNDIERLCISLFNACDIAEYRSVLASPIEGTCQWVLTNPQYVGWLSDTKSCLLWISGFPGSGKTTLSAYLLDNLSRVESSSKARPTVCCFFCDEKIETQKDGKAILRSLIFQILVRRRKLIRHVKSAYDIQGPHLVENLSELWRIFTALASDKRLGPISVIVDAIDECEENTRNRLLKDITTLVWNAQASGDSSTPRIKFLVTSRPLLGRRYTTNLLEIEEVHKDMKDDLRLVIRVKVEEIAKRTKCKPEIRSYLENTLYSKADQTFLWVTLVLEMLERSYLASQKDFHRIIDQIPQGLVATYDGFLSNISVEYQGLAAKLLHIIVGSFRPLNFEEIRVLLALQESHRTLAAVEEEYQPNIRDTVEGILGPLVRISNSRVNLIHQSFKDYIFDLSTRVENPLSEVYGTNPQKASMVLTKACISYLQLDVFKEDLFSAYQSKVEDSPISPVAQSLNVDDKALFFDPFDLAEDAILRDPTIVEAEVCESIAEKYKLFEYSAMHWAKHFSSCSTVCSQEICESALKISEISGFPGLNWFRYYWYYTEAGLSFPYNFDSFVIACFFGHLASVNVLWENQHLLDQEKVACGMYWAARMGHQDVVGRLLQCGVLPDSKIVHGKTPLTAAVQFGHQEVVRLLLRETGIDINYGSFAGRTPLSIAASNGHSGIVTQLLTHEQIQPDISDNDKSTPLFWAVGGKHFDIVRMLVEDERVDVNHLDKRGRNVFSWAAEAGENKLVKYLLSCGNLDVSRKDLKGRTALSRAAENGQLETISILRKSQRVEVSGKDNKGRNAISWACSGGHHAALSYLVKYDPAGVDEEDESGWTPLAWALDKDDVKTVQILLETGLVDVNRKDQSGRAPLFWAAVYGYVDIVKVLIKVEGVKIDIKNNVGTTPLGIARVYGHTEVVNVLEGLNE